ncbi:hypothetical protein GWK47_015761 [Chionoecetes opilio]|uniref:Uncharacterized protein n=1 Tax=Chionoecetes opilio TaxID=41210 RepID=A0A8J4XUX4_CHIOP|nr:hypothetical protein GWK47_015761 [Chionoecetes opilio]
MAKNIEALKRQQVFLNFSRTHHTPNPLDSCLLGSTTSSFSARKLTKSKADLSPARAGIRGKGVSTIYSTHAADVFFTDGSVDTTTGTAATDVHHDEFAALYRLPNNPLHSTD